MNIVIKLFGKTQPLQRLIFAVLMILSLIVLVLGLSISYVFQKDLLIERTIETTQINALQSSESLQNMFFNMDNILRAVTVELQLYTHEDEDIQQLIDSSVGLNQILDSMTLVDASGEIKAHSPSYRRLTEDIRPLEADWYQIDDQFDQALYSAPHRQTIFRQNPIDVISVTVPFLHQGETLTLIADFPIDVMERYFKGEFNSSYGDSFIINDKQQIIYASEDLNERTPAIHNQIIQEEPTLVNRLIADTENDFVVATHRIGMTPWVVVHVSYINNLIENSLNSIIRSSFGIFLLLMMIITFLSFKASNYISHPLEKIVLKMQALNRENITDSYIDDTKLQASNTYKEANLLTQSYNQLVDTILYLMSRIKFEEQALRKSERNTLEAQIQPHFLYNTLESILWMIERGNNQDASHMVRSLGKMLRITLSKGQEKITLAKELEQVEHYFVIQSLRYKGQFHYEIDIAENLRDCQVIKLIVQPLVENAIYHGVSRTVDPGLIEIQASQQGEQVVITVSDNGLGIDDEKLKEIREHLSEPNPAFGLGLVNVHQRLQIYYGEAYGVTVETELDVGTEVTINFPIEQTDSLK